MYPNLKQMANTNLTNTVDRLMELPQAIQELQMEILDLNTESNKSTELISNIQSKIKVEINSEVDANGKKTFSNAEARDAEFIERTKFNSELAGLRGEHDALQREIQEKKIQVECLSNEQRNSRSILNFFAGENETV
jgi:predicted  nucleic acid-binding Zn-ribbon protein